MNNTKKKNTNKRVLKTAKLSDVAQKAVTFRAAMLTPFDRFAYGAQIPDQYCAPTTPYHIKNRFTVTTAADGTADLIICPSAYTHAYCFNGALSGGITLTTRDNTAYSNAGAYTAPTSLSGKLVNYRIVAMGVRVKAITSMTASQGSVVMAVVPVETIAPLKDATVGGVTPATDASQTIEAWYSQNGFPYTGSGASAVLDAGGIDNLPVSSSMSILQLAERPIEVRPKPTSAYWTFFRRTTDSQFGYECVNQASTTDCGDGTYAKIGGLETTVMKFHGCAASTAIAEVEVIYHLEGTPVITGGAGTQFAPGQSSSYVSMGTLDKVLQGVVNAATFVESLTGSALKAMSSVSRVMNTVNTGFGLVGYV